MAGYFGNEPTCARCDYPRRLHHLLGVDREYNAGNENAPGAAGTATEGNEFDPYRRTDSMNHTTANRYQEGLDVLGLLGQRTSGGW